MYGVSVWVDDDVRGSGDGCITIANATEMQKEMGARLDGSSDKSSAFKH